MLLVVDTNILFTFFWKNSAFQEIIKTKQVTLISPSYALAEITKYKEEIQKKAKISQQEFEAKRENLNEIIKFVNIQEYKGCFHEIKNSIKDLTKDQQEELLSDIDFLALAKAKNRSLWSNDKELKKQKTVIIITTEELIKLLA